MLTAKTVLAQIQKLTAKLIESGLCTDQNFPSLKVRHNSTVEIGIMGRNYALFLENVSYDILYESLSVDRNYNIKMIDGAMISLYYCFVKDRLVSHRLSYFPSPTLKSFQEEPEVYLLDEIYADMVDKRIVTVPFRFDFEKDAEICEPLVHPISHFTLGQYENCRIPVASAVTPYQFLLFILANFYRTAYSSIEESFPIYKESFETTIFSEEKEMIYLQTPNHS